jgi:hypothetical protein
MAKRETAEKLLHKLEVSSKSAARKYDGESERRRFVLPQPDFGHYKNENAYPGTAYFFVGHSYNVEHNCCGNQFSTKRRNAIKKILQSANQKHGSVPISDALADENFYSTLSRFERDWLRRLPDTALIGPAIDGKGKRISQAFTVWRKEQRKSATKPKEKKLVGALTR